MVSPSPAPVDRTGELAFRLAEMAVDRAPIDASVRTLITSRLLDSIGIALSGVGHETIVTIQQQAARHSRPDGAALLGTGLRVEASWAAWANVAALRQRDMNDMFVAAEYSHPSDCIPALLALAQQAGRSGADLLAGIIASYEAQIALARSIPLSANGLDPSGHLGPAIVCGLGALLNLPVETVYRAIEMAVHLSYIPRRMPELRPSSWRVLGPGHIARTAIDCLDASMAGLTAPSPAYETPSGLLARMLGAGAASGAVSLPVAGQPRVGALTSFPKAHEAQYQAHALIDLVLRMRPLVGDPAAIDRIEIRTSRHIHTVIGTKWRDGTVPAPRLEHDLSLIVATILEDGQLIRRRDAQRAAAPTTARLRERIETVPLDEWSARSHLTDPAIQCFGAEIDVTSRSSGRIVDRVEWADSHPNSCNPWGWAEHVERFRKTTSQVLTQSAADHLMTQCARLETLTASELQQLLPAITAI